MRPGWCGSTTPGATFAFSGMLRFHLGNFRWGIRDLEGANLVCSRCRLRMSPVLCFVFGLTRYLSPHPPIRKQRSPTDRSFRKQRSFLPETTIVPSGNNDRSFIVPSGRYDRRLCLKKWEPFFQGIAFSGKWCPARTLFVKGYVFRPMVPGQ